MSNPEFEKWARKENLSTLTHPDGSYCDNETDWALAAWQSRQPEIDALKENIRAEVSERHRLEGKLNQYRGEITSLESDVERLKADAEVYEKFVKSRGSTAIAFHKKCMEVLRLEAEITRLRSMIKTEGE